MNYFFGIFDSIQRGGTDSDAASFFARVTAAGGSLTATEKTAINTLVLSLKANSLWTRMYAIYPMVGASAASCAQNLVSSSYTGTFSGGITYASTGVTPNGTNAYMNTNLNGLSVLNKSNIHYAIYPRTNTSVGADIGITDNNTGSFEIYARHPNGNTYYENGSVPLFVAVANSLGLYIGSTIANNNHNLYKNGSSIISSVAVNNINFFNGNIYLFAMLNIQGGVPLLYTNREQAYSSIGLGLSSAQASAYYTIIQTFQTSLSRQV